MAGNLANELLADHYAICLDGRRMVGVSGSGRASKARVADSEKITINLGYVDLGRIDLMVQDGFYSNRTDFIRLAIRNLLERHADSVQKSVIRKSLDLGHRHLGRAELEAVQAKGEHLDIKVLGLATIALDVTAKLAMETISSITVLGALHASAEVRKALADRMS